MVGSCLFRAQSLNTKTKKARIAGFFSLPALISGIYISVTVALHKV
ncbi:putative membrane protein [Raoultella ornithinolytica 2-156-04_S1_C1]|nr:putative membrane protein [Raoultella ornithinolytica 2-156-04_S1_C1]